MKNAWQKGAGNLEGILIIIVLVVIALTSSQDGPRGTNFTWTPGGTISSSGSNTKSGSVSSGQVTTSSHSSDISVGSGNAPYAYQSYEEYITIDNYGRNSVDITGWQLRNGKDRRPYYLNSTLQRFSADIALIPQASLFISSSGSAPLQNVVLGPNERAIVTTGSVGARTPYTITSFKENICSGYLETSSDYAFNPPLNQSCPRPSLEPGIENMDSACRDFINTLSSCKTPDFSERDSSGEQCSNCVNGHRVSAVCHAFIKEHYSYRGCIAHHRNDPNFSGRTWRIFLGRGWEMWAEDYETIELFDRLGQLVDFENY